MALFSVNLKKRTPAPTVNDSTVIFGAAGGMADETPEPFTVATLWAHLVTKITGAFDPAGTAATLAAGAVLSANEYTDAAIENAALDTVPVRYDATQPETDCLWIAPDGRVVLITGST